MSKSEAINAAPVRDALLQLDPATHQNIRDAFHAIGDNLRPLVDALEEADAAAGGNGPLLEEHLLFAQMADLFKKSQLGAGV
jgi:hypothetical protein